MRALLPMATADDAATMGTRRRTYAPPQLRQRKPPRRFLPKRCVVKLSLGNVTAVHSPKDLGAVGVLFNRRFVEALNRDIEVEPRNLQMLALLSHVTPMMARAPAPRIVALHGLHAAHRIDDQDMKALMTDVVDRCYHFLIERVRTGAARRRRRSFRRTAISLLMGLRSST